MTAFQAIVETYLIPLQLFSALLGMGATLSLRDFALIFRHPRGLALGLGLQLVLVPLLASAFIAVFDLPEGWAVGLLLIAVVPGGAMSNLFTYLGKGSVPLSIALTTTSTLGCLVTVPLLLRLLAAQYLPAGFAFPVLPIVRDIGLYLLVPLSLGMAILRWSEPRAKLVNVWAIRLSVGCIVVIAASALGSGRIDVVAYGWRPPLLIALFGALLLVLTPQLCRLAGRYDDDTVALSIEVVVRNTSIGLLLVHFFFAGDAKQGHVLYSSLFYAGLSGLLGLPLWLRHRYGRSVVLLRQRLPRPAQLPARGSSRAA